MIGYLNGTLTIKDPTYVVMDISGVGYEVKISLSTFSKVKDLEKCLLHTYLHVKEDSHTLYGFYDRAEKEIFLQLISINGVGPNTALMVNSSLSVVEIQNAIVHGEASVIQRVKGIGAKTAQRIILELKDKIKKEGLAPGAPPISSNTLFEEALAACMTLGIQKTAAEKSIRQTLQKHGSDISLEELIKYVLKSA